VCVCVCVCVWREGEGDGFESVHVRRGGENFRGHGPIPSGGDPLRPLHAAAVHGHRTGVQHTSEPGSESSSGGPRVPAAAATFIVNVSAMEGKFYRRKLATHPHTNMAKAALNMMTRTSASDYAKSNIFMTAVDTGWINDENPLERAVQNALQHFASPLDEVHSTLTSLVSLALAGVIVIAKKYVLCSA
jgi:NAD(P)-dependent dehydrogenase (short-subunit alcohol dehydrogenase family)